MIERRAVIILAVVFVSGFAMLHFSDRSSGEDVKRGESARPAGVDFRPLPAPIQPPNLVRLAPVEQLGKDIFFDHTLSNPTGYACATCHVPRAGFTGPNSEVNATAGPVPGIVPGRVGRRKPQAVAYSAFSPYGPYFDDDLQVWLGGNFWDGRAPDNVAQAKMPFLDQNEMANTPVGPYPPHSGGFSTLVARKLGRRPYATLFRAVFGPEVFSESSDAEVYDLATRAIAAYEASAEINPFSSRYDASRFGVPPRNQYRLSASEERGRGLFFGKAQCSACHSSATLDPVLAATGGKDAFTMYCYANVGVPKNPGNPFYLETDPVSNPFGSNPLGEAFIDYGLGANPNPSPGGMRFLASTPGDIAQFRGLFKAPSARNVDRRPSSGFVKSFMHNGVFKSLEEVVHFYNKRNVAADRRGHEVVFDLRVGPPGGFVPLFAPPEVLDNVQNVAGASPDAATTEVESNGQVGNLGLTRRDEVDVVNFLRTLTDGYTRPNPATAP